MFPPLRREGRSKPGQSANPARCASSGPPTSFSLTLKLSSQADATLSSIISTNASQRSVRFECSRGTTSAWKRNATSHGAFRAAQALHISQFPRVRARRLTHSAVAAQYWHVPSGRPGTFPSEILGSGSGGPKFSRLKTETAVHESHANRRLVERALPMVLHEELDQACADSSSGVKRHFPRQRGRWVQARWEVCGSRMSLQALVRRLLYRAIPRLEWPNHS